LKLKDRVALVTGASRRSGIGAAICRALAAEGATIFFTHWAPYDRTMNWNADENAPQALAEEISNLGVRCEHMSADLSQPETPARIMYNLEAEMGMASILVNNATHSVNGGYETLNAAIIDAHYLVNMRGMMLLSAEFVRRFKASHGGRIINLTSGQSLAPMPEELAYATTKGAVEAFTTSLSASVGERGITVNAVDPGPTDTGWISDELRPHLLARFPQGRLGMPEDAARLIAFLATDDAGWITGQVIHSHGGFHHT
jgi:3-oxoacyl-[acyl-carrier protein] reductase